AMAMMSRSVPLDMVQMNSSGLGAAPSAIMPAGGILSPPGVPGVPGTSGAVINANVPPGMKLSGGVVQANYPPGAPGAQGGMAQGPRFALQRTQIRFVKPSGMKVSWFTQGPDGRPAYSTTPIDVPGRYNFSQGAIYRLKLSNIEGRPGLEVYP